MLNTRPWGATLAPAMASVVMYGYETGSWVLVAERATVFRPHVGTKSVPQELGADSSGAWRLVVVREGSVPCSTAADSLTVESGMQGL